MEIDYAKLSRDYRVCPLKRGEIIPKEDLQYLFIDSNLTLKQMAQIINRHPNQIGRQCKFFEIIKEKEKKKESLKKEFRKADVIPKITNIQNLMLTKFKDVIIDYKTDLFVWDYYIPSLDLYISYNVSIEHGGEPFNAKNQEHWNKLHSWADKAQRGETIKEKNYYTNLINTWTVTDVLKRNTIREKNLKYKEFFTEKEFMQWFNDVL